MANKQEKLYQIALSTIKGVGRAHSQKLMAHFGSAEAIFASSLTKLLKIPGLNSSLAKDILSKKSVAYAEKLLLYHEQVGVRIVTLWENDYPERLRHIPSAPLLLYIRGNVSFSSKDTKIISIVGTRRATDYGKKVIETLLSELSSYPLLIVSGLAYGVDIHAHKIALELGIPTLAVVAGCVRNVYPSAHQHIAQEMVANEGAVVSEHPIQTKPELHRFAIRNRIIAGIADTTIVVEAGKKSGALITARWANEYSREVFAVSGSIYDTYSAGCHHLIKTHQANLLTSAADIVDVMNWHQSTIEKSKPLSVLQRFTDLTKIEQSAVSAIGMFHQEVSLEDLSTQAKIPMSQLAATMLSLEMKKIVKVLPGRKLRLATR